MLILFCLFFCLFLRSSTFLSGSSHPEFIQSRCHPLLSCSRTVLFCSLLFLPAKNISFLPLFHFRHSHHHHLLSAAHFSVSGRKNLDYIYRRIRTFVLRTVLSRNRCSFSICPSLFSIFSFSRKFPFLSSYIFHPPRIYFLEPYFFCSRTFYLLLFHRSGRSKYRKESIPEYRE